jgi:hypothetical protein
MLIFRLLASPFLHIFSLIPLCVNTFVVAPDLSYYSCLYDKETVSHPKHKARVRTKEQQQKLCEMDLIKARSSPNLEASERHLISVRTDRKGTHQIFQALQRGGSKSQASVKFVVVEFNYYYCCLLVLMLTCYSVESEAGRRIAQ